MGLGLFPTPPSGLVAAAEEEEEAAGTMHGARGEEDAWTRGRKDDVAEKQGRTVFTRGRNDVAEKGRTVFTSDRDTKKKLLG